jgi:hypothetical protein
MTASGGTIRNICFVLLVTFVLLAIPAPALAQGGSPADDDLVVLTGGAQVSEGETAGDVIVFDGPVSIAGTARGDVVAFNGRVDVSGVVRGDLVVFNGRVAVADGAEVSGDVRSRTTAQIDPGANVGGDVRGLDFRAFDEAVASARIGIWLAFSVSALVLVLAFVLLFPRGADHVAEAGVRSTGSSIGWGLLLFFGIPIVAVILLITLLGIPLGIGLLLAIAPLYALGYVASGYFLGRRIISPPRARALAAVVGIVILRVVALIPILGGLVWFAATVFGLGLLIVAGRQARELETEPRPVAPRAQEA